MVEAVLLAISIGLVTWTADTVIKHGNTLASQDTKINGNELRIQNIESRGSSGLQAHEVMDDTRIGSLSARMDKIEQAILNLQSAPARLEAIQARLDGLMDGQKRIESQMMDHLKSLK